MKKSLSSLINFMKINCILLQVDHNKTSNSETLTNILVNLIIMV